MLEDCMLGTQGGWKSVTHSNNHSSDLHLNCAYDIYMRKNDARAIGCEGSGAKVIASDEVDEWLCSEPCTMDTPCLYHIANDEQEKNECSSKYPDVVK